MQQVLTFAIASVTPVMIFLYLIYKKDKNKEPMSLLIKCLLGGFLVAGIAILVELGLHLAGRDMEDGLFHSAYTAFIVAALTEEGLKWMVVRWLVWKNADFDEHYDGIIYAVFVSLGFALIENLMYVFDGGLKVALVRAVLAVPGHGLFAVLMGYHLSLAKFSKPEETNRHLFMGLFFPVVFHGLYDFALMYMGEQDDNNPLVILGLLILFTFVVIRLWIVGIRNIKRHINKDIEVNSTSIMSSENIEPNP
jgi:RsiW-degrading membrane proteinase PrsW (M82 family)